MKQNKTFINDSTKMKQLLKIYHNDSVGAKTVETLGVVMTLGLFNSFFDFVV